MARLPFVEPESASPAAREAFALLPVHLNVTEALGRARDAGPCQGWHRPVPPRP
jgi:hypothetical protein